MNVPRDRTVAAASAEESDGERFRFRKRIAPYARAILAGVLPCPDIPSRYRMRSRARKLARCGPWPEESSTSLDVAKLAVLRLLWLQRQTRRAVRGRHREAAVLLARSSVETCILGFYCLHEPGAPAQLEAANLKALRDMLRSLEDMDLIPGDVIDQCLRALGRPRRAPDVKQMAQQVDRATGGGDAISLYRNLYVPTSNFFAHGAGAACSVMSARRAG